MIEMSTLPVKVGCRLCRGTSRGRGMRRTVSHAQGLFNGRGLILSMSELSCDGKVLRHLRNFSAFLRHRPRCCNGIALTVIVIPSHSRMNDCTRLGAGVSRRVNSVGKRCSAVS